MLTTMRNTAIAAALLALVPSTRAVGAPSLERAPGAFLLRPGDRVLLLGDAVTVDGRFWHMLASEIGREYPKLEPRVVNGGVAGDTAADGARRVDELVARHRPTVAVVCFGLNDAIDGAGEYADAMTRIVQILESASVAVTLVTPPWIGAHERPELEPHAVALAELAERLREISRSEGVLLSDCLAAMRSRAEAGTRDMWWADGIHPNERGHRMMADALRETWRFGKPLAAPKRASQEKRQAERSGARDILRNGDFSRSADGRPEGWRTVDTPQNVELTTLETPPGVAACLRVRIEETAKHDGQVIQRLTDFDPDATYVLAGMMRSEGGARIAYMQVKLLDGRKELRRISTERSSNEWRRVSCEFSPRGADQIQVLCRWRQDDKGVGATAWFADVALREKSAPQ